MKKTYLLLTFVLLSLLSCKKDQGTQENGEPAVINVFSGTSFELEGYNQEAVINFLSNKEWKAEVTKGSEWCSITPTYGDAGENHSIIIFITENIDAVRNAEITITAGDDNTSEVITISQNPIPADPIIEFKDAKFKAALLDKSRSHIPGNIDENGDGEISMSEAALVSKIDVDNETSNEKINSVDELKYFVKLEELSCGNNEIAELDISQNYSLTILACFNNMITKLDVKENLSLALISCYSNQLSSLDVSNNTMLTMLICSDNKLREINIGTLPLIALYCDDNELTSLDLSGLPALINLICHNNYLRDIDVSSNTILNVLHCQENELTSLDVSANIELVELACCQNNLTSLDVSMLSKFPKEKLLCGAQVNGATIDVTMTSAQNDLPILASGDLAKYNTNVNVLIKN